MDSSLYAQQSQSQSQFSSPLYMQHVYPQQQYPVYGIVPPTWTPSPTPYFETPLVRETDAQPRTRFLPLLLFCFIFFGFNGISWQGGMQDTVKCL